MNIYIKRNNESKLTNNAFSSSENPRVKMFSDVTSKAEVEPRGFSTTPFAYEEFLTYNSLHFKLFNLLSQLDRPGFSNLETIGRAARKIIADGKFQSVLEMAIIQAYWELCNDGLSEVVVSTYGSREDFLVAAYFGEEVTFQNIKGEKALLEAIIECYASLYSDQAIRYREEHHFEHLKISQPVNITKRIFSTAIL